MLLGKQTEGNNRKCLLACACLCRPERSFFVGTGEVSFSVRFALMDLKM